MRPNLTVPADPSYFLLCGYTPFDRESQYQEMQAICNGDYKFAPAEYWAGVSDTAKEFVRACLTVDPVNRPTAADLLQHPWLKSEDASFKQDPEKPSGESVNLLPNVKKAFDAKKTCAYKRRSSLGDVLTTVRRAVQGMLMVHRLQVQSERHQSMGGMPESEREKLRQEVAAFKEEAEKVSAGCAKGGA